MLSRASYRSITHDRRQGSPGLARLPVPVTAAIDRSVAVVAVEVVAGVAVPRAAIPMIPTATVVVVSIGAPESTLP